LKKTWIMLKRGLLTPEHRMRMAERVWLFMHIIDRADWELGRVIEWRDRDESELLEMPIRTLREQRRRLENDDYIRSLHRGDHLEIVILKWANPRKYDGAVINIDDQEEPVPPDMGGVQTDKSGSPLPLLDPGSDSDDNKSGNPLPPTSSPLDESYIKSDNESSIQDGTLPIRSLSQESLRAVVLHRDDIAEMVKVWEMAAGPITAMTAENLADMATEAEHHRIELPPGSDGHKLLGPQWVAEAIREGAKSSKGRLSIRYVNAILRRWQVEGFKSDRRSQTDSRHMTPEEHDQWMKNRRAGAKERIRKAKQKRRSP